jgi:hypothetical protein
MLTFLHKLGVLCAKNGLGYTLGDFFKNSSGDPAYVPHKILRVRFHTFLGAKFTTQMNRVVIFCKGEMPQTI